MNCVKCGKEIDVQKGDSTVILDITNTAKGPIAKDVPVHRHCITAIW